MIIEIHPINHLKKNPDNPRHISDRNFEKLVNSIKDFPEMLKLRPIVVDADMVVLGGNMRLRACKAAGLTEVPIIRADTLTPQQQREFIIKDNVGYGEWDWEVLRLEWPDEDLEGWGLDIPMPELDEAPEAKEDNYQIPEKIKTDIVPGDVFQIGPHRLICGDARDPLVWEVLTHGQLLDMITTDPPYNVDYAGKNPQLNKAAKGNRNQTPIENDKQSDPDFYEFLLDAFKAMAIFTKPGGAWYVWHADSEGLNFRNAFVDAGLLHKQCLIWVKNNMVLGRQDYQWKHEPCLYGWKPGAAHYFTPERTNTTVFEDLQDFSKLNKKQLLKLIADMTAETIPNTVIHCDKPHSSSEHPTMKPVKLIGANIENSSKIGDRVGDGFGGSGTTMVACHQLRRVCYMAEDAPTYCQVIIDRMRLLDPDIEIKRIHDDIF